MSVPWVRIPPPPPFKPPAKGGFFSGFWAYKHSCKYTSHIPLGDYVGTEEFSPGFKFSKMQLFVEKEIIFLIKVA